MRKKLKWIWRIATTLVVLAVGSLWLAGCALEAMMSETSDDGGIPRQTVTVPLAEGDVDVSFRVTGDATGQRIIYVHGTPGSDSAYNAYLKRPELGLEHLSYDRPGFGRTSPNDAVTSFEEQAKVIEPFLVERDGRWPILVGHSLGGPIIAQAAAMYPDRVAGMVIVAGSLDPELENPRWYNHVADWLIIRWALPKELCNSNDEIMDAPEETKKLAEMLPRVTCPVVIVHGDKDRLVPVGNVDYMERSFTNAASVESTIIEGKRHFILWTTPDVIREAINGIATPNEVLPEGE